MNPLAPATWWLTLVGWSVIVALWHTSALALGVATWHLWRRDVAAGTQYRIAAAALALATALTLATPALLLSGGRSIPQAPPRTATRTEVAGAPVAVAHSAPSPTTRSEAWQVSARAVTEIAAPWIGMAWCFGFAVGLMRLAAGWSVARWIRRRAIAVSSAQLVAAARDAAATWGLPVAPVLVSAHVEAPVVIGARAPVVLLPIDLEQRLDPVALPPLLAHELAHVHRRDYAANLLQALADTLLFFSPGARWLSRTVREAREYCCDDLVAARCGVGAYASALTTLAGLGVAATARPVVNAAGPRLIVRIRRLLREDTMARLNRVHLSGLSCSCVAAAAAGIAVLPVGVAAVASRAAEGQAIQSAMTPIAVSFIRENAGTAVVVEGMEPTAGGLCGVATIRNGTGVAVRSIRFEAEVVRGRSLSLSSGGERTIEILPAATSRVAVNLLPATDALSVGGSGRADVTCTLVAVRFADGSSWLRSAARPGRRDASLAGSRNVVTFTAPIEGPVPMGFIHTQRGLAVRLRDMTSSDAASCGQATLENRANVAVTGVRFAAQAMAGGPEGSSLISALSASSPMLDVDVLPGATATVAANLVSLDDLRQTVRTGSPQVMCAIAEVRYANGSTWTSSPGAVFAPTHAEVARALIGRPPVQGAAFCRDQDGGEYSEGALVPIALEPGMTVARCHEGAWAEYELPPPPPDAAR